MDRDLHRFYWFIKGYQFGILKKNKNTNIVFTLIKEGRFFPEDISYANDGEEKRIGFNKVGYPKGTFSAVRIYDDGRIKMG